MIEYFVLQLLFIAFEKQYLSFSEKKEWVPTSNNDTNPNNSLNFLENYFFSFNSNETNNDTDTKENNGNSIRIDDVYTFLIFVITFFLFFYFTLTFNTIIHFSDKSMANIFGEKIEVPVLGIDKLSNGILDGTHGILIFDGLFAIIFSSIYLYNSEHEIFSKINFFMVPILMNKFYYFTLTYYCISYSEKKKQFELISGSTLISIYLFIWETIDSLIRDYISLHSLYIIQIILSILPCFVLLFMILRPLIKTFFKPYLDCKTKFSFFFSFLCCYCSLILCFGGFWCNSEWFDETTKIMDYLWDCICECDCRHCDCSILCIFCNCKCCEENCNCCIECLDYCCNCLCCDRKDFSECQCCTCCEC